MAQGPASVKCARGEKVYKQWGSPQVLYLLRGGCTPGIRGCGLPVLCFKAGFWCFFEGLSLKTSFGSAPVVWSQRTSSDGPCGVVTALLPGFESILNLHGSPWGCLNKAGKTLSQGCFSGSSALCRFMVNWSCTEGYPGSEQGILVPAESEIPGGLSEPPVTHLIQEGATENQ